MAIYHQKTRSDAGNARRADDRRDGERRTLPLGGRIEKAERGWRLRLKVRAEEVSVSKRTVVAEEVIVRTTPVEDVARVRETVRREELRVDTTESLHADVTQPIDSAFRSDRTDRFDAPTTGSRSLND